MRFLVDENVPRRLTEALIVRGHDVTRVQDLAVAAADHNVLRHAVRLSAVLITLDSDFGTLVYAHGSEPPPAIVLVRLGAADLKTFWRKSSLSSKPRWRRPCDSWWSVATASAFGRSVNRSVKAAVDRDNLQSIATPRAKSAIQ